MSSFQEVHPPSCDASLAPSPIVSRAIAPFFVEVGVALQEIGCEDAGNLCANAQHLHSPVKLLNCNENLEHLLKLLKRNDVPSLLSSLVNPCRCHRNPWSSHGPRLGACNQCLQPLKLGILLGEVQTGLAFVEVWEIRACKRGLQLLKLGTQTRHFASHLLLSLAANAVIAALFIDYMWGCGRTAWRTITMAMWLSQCWQRPSSQKRLRCPFARECHVARRQRRKWHSYSLCCPSCRGQPRGNNLTLKRGNHCPLAGSMRI